MTPCTALTSMGSGFHRLPYGADGASHHTLTVTAIDPTTAIRSEDGAFYDPSTALNM